MTELTLSMEGLAGLPAGLQVETLTLDGQARPYLTITPVNGSIPRAYTVFRTERVALSSLAAVTVEGVDLDYVRLFLVIDGVLSSYNGTGWVPVPASALPSVYPSLGLPVGGFSAGALAAAHADGRRHSIGLGILMDSNGTVSPKVLRARFSGQSEEVAGSLHLTRVRGTFPTASGFSVPMRFRVELSRAAVAYGGYTLTSKAIEVVPNQTTGAWEVSLPDTEGMADPLAAYLFYFNNFTPIARKVPAVDEIEFRSLPVFTGA